MRELSHWAIVEQVQFKREYFDTLERVCQAHGLTFIRDTLTIMAEGELGSSANLRAIDGDKFSLYIDTDPRYSAVLKRLGGSLDRFVRDYSEEVVMDTMARTGYGYLEERVECEDGSLRLVLQVGE